jgi:membrane protein implicated in regulation of membrane protease activity
MEFKLLYWHWLVLGMVMILAEIFIPSFTIFWFGLGAILVGGILLLIGDQGNIDLRHYCVSRVSYESFDL